MEHKQIVAAIIIAIALIFAAGCNFGYKANSTDPPVAGFVMLIAGILFLLLIPWR